MGGKKSTKKNIDENGMRYTVCLILLGVQTVKISILETANLILLNRSNFRHILRRKSNRIRPFFQFGFQKLMIDNLWISKVYEKLDKWLNSNLCVCCLFLSEYDW